MAGHNEIPHNNGEIPESAKLSFVELAPGADAAI
jgi:hypothetical protein